MSYHIGIDLGGTNIAVGITNGYNEIVARNSRKTKAAKSFEALVADIAQTAKEAIHVSEIAENEIISVGMGTPSCINPETGLLVNANNLGWHNVPLQKEIEIFPATRFHSQRRGLRRNRRSIRGRGAGRGQRRYGDLRDGSRRRHSHKPQNFQRRRRYGLGNRSHQIGF